MEDVCSPGKVWTARAVCTRRGCSAQLEWVQQAGRGLCRGVAGAGGVSPLAGSALFPWAEHTSHCRLKETLTSQYATLPSADLLSNLNCIC